MNIVISIPTLCILKHVSLDDTGGAKMKDTHNIGPLNAIIRIALGFVLFAWAVVHIVRKPYKSTPYYLVALCAGAKIGSGILRYCPFTTMCKNCFSLEAHHLCVTPMKEILKETLEEFPHKKKEEMDAINPS